MANHHIIQQSRKRSHWSTIVDGRYTHFLMSLLTEHSEKMTDGIYLELSNLLKQIHEATKCNLNENTRKDLIFILIKQHFLILSYCDLDHSVDNYEFNSLPFVEPTKDIKTECGRLNPKCYSAECDNCQRRVTDEMLTECSYCGSRYCDKEECNTIFRCGICEAYTCNGCDSYHICNDVENSNSD